MSQLWELGLLFAHASSVLLRVDPSHMLQWIVPSPRRKLFYFLRPSSRAGSRPFSSAFTRILGSGAAAPRNVFELVDLAQVWRVQLNVIHLGAVIAACGGQRWRQALHFKDSLVTLALRPDTVLYGSLLHACRESWEIAVMLLEEMCHERINRDLICFNATLSALATAGRWQEALRLMRRMELSPDVVSFTAAISACGVAAEWRRAVDLLSSLRALDVETVDTRCFNSCLAACENASVWVMALALLDHMSQCRTEPSVVSFNSATSSAMSASIWQMALLLWLAMPKQMIQPDIVSLGIALFRISLGPGVIESATWWFEHAMACSMAPAVLPAGSSSSPATRLQAAERGPSSHKDELYNVMLDAGACSDAVAQHPEAFGLSGAPVLGRPGGGVEVFDVSEAQLLGCQDLGFVPWRFGHALICVAAGCDSEYLVRQVVLPAFFEALQVEALL
eukprot:s145_g22.t1